MVKLNINISEMISNFKVRVKQCTYALSNNKEDNSINCLKESIVNGNVIEQ